MAPKGKRQSTGGGHGRASKGANTSACNVEKDFEEDFHEDVGHQIIDDIYMPPPPKHPNLTGNQLGERLIIVDIEITNFKSYGGTTILGPFHKAFNSIVGPNGSGKSNVIDSMLFVFGYRATKIRSKQISNIIHHSDTMPNCLYAKVKVNFAMLNDKGGLDHDIIPNSEFSISRVVEKNNNSYYMIDGSRVSFRDVSKKLEEFSIDLRYNRFLILQGEVEQISLMKPKGDTEGDTGMLEFLEDIIGTSRYKLPIKQLNDKYYALNEARTVYVNRVNLCQKELNTVSELKNEAVKALELQNKIFIEKSKIYQLHIHEESRLLEADEAEFAQEKAKMDSLDERLEEAQNQCVELSTQEKEKAGEFLKMKEDRDKLKAKWEECNQKDYYLHKKGKATKKDIKKLTTQIEADEAKLEELKKAAEENNDDTETKDLEAKRTELEKEQEKIDEQLKEGTQAAQEECADLITERDALDAKLTQFKEESSGKKKARDEAENNLMVLTVQRDKAKTKVAGLETKLKHLNDETEEKRTRVAKFEVELPKQKRMITEKTQAVGDLEREHQALETQFRTKRAEHQTLVSEKDNAVSGDKVHKALMEEMRHGRLQGIFGKLGALGAIDEKYDVAASTASGRLRNYVVDTSENAKAANRFLKEFNRNRANAGSVTFIILDKLGDWTRNYQRNRQYPEGVPRIFDLIRVNDERFLPAFYFAFRDTLVAEDLEQASRIGHSAERHRVISLKGELIETDGSISGGGRPCSGAIGTTVQQDTTFDQQRINDLEAEMDELIQQKGQLELKIETARRELKQLHGDLKVIEDNFAILNQDIHQNVSRIEQTAENLRNAKEEMARFENNPEIELAEAAYQKKKEIYEREEAKMTTEKEKLDLLNEEINSKLITQLEPIKKQKKALEKKMKELVARINSIASERKNCELQLKKLEEDLETNRATIAQLKDELEKIEEEKKKVTEEGVEANNLYEQAMKDVEDLGKTLVEMQKKGKQLEETMKKAKSEKVDVGHEIEKKLKVLEEKRKKKNDYCARLSEIVLNQIDIDSDDESEKDGDGVNAAIPKLSEEELDELNVDSIRSKIKRLESDFSKLNPNYAAIEDYKRTREDFKTKSADLENATSRRDLYMEHMKQTKEKRLTEFKTGYHSIAHKLKELYRTITLGGDADLEFVDSLDPFSEGINFAVRPNKKSWKNNINLSGGEKTLSSLALIFALHYYKPSPLYIMDEIDAALDFKNVSIIANYIKQRTRNTQFLIISLRSNMYELAEMLIGVYKTFSVSKTLALDPTAYEYREKHHGTQSIFSSQPIHSSQPTISSSQQQQYHQSSNSSKASKKLPPSATFSSQSNFVNPLPPSDAPPSPPLRAPVVAVAMPASHPPPSSPSSSSSSSPPRQKADTSFNSEEDGDLMDLT